MGQALKSNQIISSTVLTSTQMQSHGFGNGEVKDLLLTALDIRVSHAPLGNGARETQMYRKVQSALRM